MTEVGYVKRVGDRPQIHVEEGVTTFGRKDAVGVPRLYIEVKDETGAVVYTTWQNGPLGDWGGYSLWD
jgi:hypothetical protein